MFHFGLLLFLGLAVWKMVPGRFSYTEQIRNALGMIVLDVQPSQTTS